MEQAIAILRFFADTAPAAHAAQALEAVELLRKHQASTARVLKKGDHVVKGATVMELLDDVQVRHVFTFGQPL